MLVTRVEQIGKKKFKVYCDYDYAFTLFLNQLYEYGLSEERELSEDVYEQILKEEIYPAAKRKAMDLLKVSDKSEFMLRRKLGESFPQCAVEVAIEYLNSYHYIDDKRYAREYYESHKTTKSYTDIVLSLKQNGVSKETLEEAVSDMLDDVDVFDEEAEAAKSLLRKKGYYDMEEVSYEQRMKFKSFLFRKGFSEATIRRVMERV